ncbi:hypothetical protein B2A_13908, partial [mine drainage metagenome]
LDALEPMWERLQTLQANPDTVREVLANGSARARLKARDTLGEVRDALGLARPA